MRIVVYIYMILEVKLSRRGAKKGGSGVKSSIIDIEFLRLLT
jgi:hypothetical protein